MEDTLMKLMQGQGPWAVIAVVMIYWNQKALNKADDRANLLIGAFKESLDKLTNAMEANHQEVHNLVSQVAILARDLESNLRHR